MIKKRYSSIIPVKSEVTMNLWETIKNCEDTLTPKEMEVYKLVLEEPFLFSSSTAGNLAARFNIAQSAISRFCQKIGFQGFNDFRIALGLAMATHNFRDEAAVSDDSADKDLCYYITALIRETKDALSDSQLESLAKRTLSADTAFLSGFGNSYPPANMLAIRLLLAHVHSHLIQPGFEIETLHIMKPNDIVFLFSAQNPTHRDFVSFVRELPKENRPYIVLIANTTKHPLKRLVDETVCLPSWNALRYPIMVDSATAPIAFCSFFSERVNKMAEEAT
jgi:DNA-binding MurR/RpiR family transcriptional regulator